MLEHKFNITSVSHSFKVALSKAVFLSGNESLLVDILHALIEALVDSHGLEISLRFGSLLLCEFYLVFFVQLIVHSEDFGPLRHESVVLMNMEVILHGQVLSVIHVSSYTLIVCLSARWGTITCHSDLFFDLLNIKILL